MAVHDWDGYHRSVEAAFGSMADEMSTALEALDAPEVWVEARSWIGVDRDENWRVCAGIRGRSVGVTRQDHNSSRTAVELYDSTEIAGLLVAARPGPPADKPPLTPADIRILHTGNWHLDPLEYAAWGYIHVFDGCDRGREQPRGLGVFWVDVSGDGCFYHEKARNEGQSHRVDAETLVEIVDSLIRRIRRGERRMIK